MDQWTLSGPRITDAPVMERLVEVLEREGELIVEHRFYRGASGPHIFICHNAEELQQYLEREARPGDHFWIWSYVRVCSDAAALAHGKVPDAAGRTPEGGAY